VDFSGRRVLPKGGSWASAFSTRHENAGTDHGPVGMLSVRDKLLVNSQCQVEESTLRKTLFHLITTSRRQSIELGVRVI
jgi:hypothetical protein